MQRLHQALTHLAAKYQVGIMNIVGNRKHRIFIPRSFTPLSTSTNPSSECSPSTPPSPRPPCRVPVHSWPRLTPSPLPDSPWPHLMVHQSRVWASNSQHSELHSLEHQHKEHSTVHQHLEVAMLPCSEIQPLEPVTQVLERATPTIHSV